MFLSLSGEWGLRPLVGITTSPLLDSNGGIRIGEGYDTNTGMWCARIPALPLLQESPTKLDAEVALSKLREAFRTFPFADATCRSDASLNVEVVDVGKPPGLDESTFLSALLTAVCRSSLQLAPGVVVRAPAISGSGTGKGLLVRAISTIAFGTIPPPFTVGESRNELDKRLTAGLVEGKQMIFIDNVNGRALKSDLLSQALTEGPVIVSRRLGATQMLQLSCKAFIAMTGNDLAISEDLVRRFVVCELDARCENPEQRRFSSNFLEDIQRRRAELLAAVLSIWRWGRQNLTSLQHGRPLGSFEEWASWCRDPLVSLGARDPIERIDTLKASDPERAQNEELFVVWNECHGDRPVAVRDLADPVCEIIDHQGRGRQFLAAYLQRLTNTQIGGYVLTRQSPTGRCGRATYAVRRRTD